MTVEISRVSVEHHLEPLGISESSPRLSWRFSGATKDWVQKSYTLSVTRAGGKPESTTVGSDQSVLVPWPFKPLASREVVDVEVEVTGKDGAALGKKSVRIEVGLLEKSQWKAKMISGEQQDKNLPKRPIRFRSTFNRPAKGQARLYVTAHGVYEAYLNGKRIGQDLLSPGWTDYEYHLPYGVHDVTDLLVEGDNVLGGYVGEGWYATRLGWREGVRNLYGDRIGLLAQLEVDGQVVTATGGDWEWSYGSVTKSELYDGEKVDSTVSDDWTQGTWKKVEEVAFPKGELLSTQSPPVREVERIDAVEVIKTPKGKTIIDFGQNFAGFVEFLSSPPKSGKLVLTHAEVLEHGELGIRPLRECTQADEIILGGDLKGWRPKFTFHGFRYVQVDGWEGIKKSDLVGIVVSTAMERTGTFESSHKLLNRLHLNVVYSTLANTVSLPTDCPQRDERLGWTGDIQVFTPTLGYLFDAAGFMRGWLKDVYSDQVEAGGSVPVVIPIVRGLIPGAMDSSHAIWGDVAVLAPWDLYNMTSDINFLKDQFESVKLWLEKGVNRDPETNMWSREKPQLADWLAPAASPDAPDVGPTDNYLVADAYLAHTTRVASYIAKTIGDTKQAAKFAADADKLTETFHSEYVTSRSRVVSDTQTALCLILHFNLINPSAPKQKEILARRLGQLVERDMWKVSTGFAGTPIVLSTLMENDMLHHAYRMLQAKDCPSWLSPVLLGATTIWERWDSMLADGSINPGEMTSFNHYALGSVAAFMHEVIGGISPLEPGWKKILIRPQPGGTVSSAKVSYMSAYGKVACEWEIKGSKLGVKIAVPPNCTAQVVLPGVDESVGSGEKAYEVDWKEDERFPPKKTLPGFSSVDAEGYVQ